MSAELYLIPTTLGDSNAQEVLPIHVVDIIKSTNYYIVENIRTARRFIKKVYRDKDIDSTTFFVLNKHTKPEELSNFLSPCKKGHTMGIISEAGCPGVADPGADVVAIAHRKNIKVIPLVGPSSILLSLMASGLNGQNFAFLGYIPHKDKRISFLKNMENDSRVNKQTKIFIETPFRNNALLADILNSCTNNTLLCIACNITLSDEFIKTKSIAEWKKEKLDLNKKPTIFLLQG